MVLLSSQLPLLWPALVPWKSGRIGGVAALEGVIFLYIVVFLGPSGRDRNTMLVRTTIGVQSYHSYQYYGTVHGTGAYHLIATFCVTIRP